MGPCGGLKAAEHLCAMILVFLMSPREQTDPFRLPAEVAEWGMLLLNRERSTLQWKEIQSKAQFEVR